MSAVLFLLVYFAVPVDSSVYHKVSGLQCVRPEFFVIEPRARFELECASLCDAKVDCQAFSVADGPCQLFVFNRCNKYVRDCSCNRTARVFVKQQPGLPPGALCPAGFADDFCGTKYKLYGGIQDWDVAKAAIDALPGLTIMADVTDLTELTHIRAMEVRSALYTIILGGRQLPGSEEPAGGWIWASCNISIDSSLWYGSQPDNYGGVENYASTMPVSLMLNDFARVSESYVGALSECVSPFDK